METMPACERRGPERRGCLPIDAQSDGIFAWQVEFHSAVSCLSLHVICLRLITRTRHFFGVQLKRSSYVYVSANFSPRRGNESPSFLRGGGWYDARFGRISR